MIDENVGRESEFYIDQASITFVGSETESDDDVSEGDEDSEAADAQSSAPRPVERVELELNRTYLSVSRSEAFDLSLLAVEVSVEMHRRWILQIHNARTQETPILRASSVNDVEDGREDPEYLCPLCTATYVIELLYSRGIPSSLAGVLSSPPEHVSSFDINVTRHQHLYVASITQELETRGLDGVPRECFHRGIRNFCTHVLHDHSSRFKVPALCPICVSLPHGDPNYIVQNFYAHAERRHGFDWTLYMPYLHRDENEMIAEVLRASEQTADAERVSRENN
jgi:hypothetical protein